MSVDPAIWIGDRYHESQHRLLILGESWYGEEDPLDQYIRRWAQKKQADATFSRIFNACSGLHTDTATTAQRLDWWNTITFCNFVEGSVGDTRASRPTRSHYLAATARLDRLLSTLMPAGVWVLGTGQGEYSAPVIAKRSIMFEVTPHPTSYGVKSETLRASWLALQARVPR